MKLPVSAMVVGYNEACFLDQCIGSISFCEEIFYIDLGSTDNSLQIAEKYGCKVVQMDRTNVPSGEIAQAAVVDKLKNDWVIFIDPDEKVDPSLKEQLIVGFSGITSDPVVGATLVPWIFYFKKRPLKGTVWGGNNQKYLLVNRKRFDFLPVTHYGRRIKEGFETREVKPDASGKNILHHYWMSNFKIFFAKHKRYLKKEGRDNYNLGVRMSKKNFVLTPFREFYHCFFKSKGFRDGFTGLVLSAFWAYYRTYIALDLLHIQKTGLSFNEQKLKKTA